MAKWNRLYNEGLNISLLIIGEVKLSVIWRNKYSAVDQWRSEGVCNMENSKIRPMINAKRRCLYNVELQKEELQNSPMIIGELVLSV